VKRLTSWGQKLRNPNYIRFGIIVSLVSFLSIYLTYVFAFSGHNLDKFIDNATKTSLEDILLGKFTTSLDKSGKNGTVVEVDELKVSQIMRAIDGDVHVHVTKGNITVFVTEITPYWQLHGVKSPRIGDVINITGVVFWDSDHIDEEWHGKTGWEIHPVIKIDSAS